MRDMTPEMSAKSEAKTVDMILFMEGRFPSETLRFWTGKGDFPWNGELWKGSGDFIRISEVEETGEKRATGYTLTLAGVMPDSIEFALREDQKGSLVTVWLAFVEFNPGEMAVVNDAMVLFKGFSAAMKTNDENGRAEILLDVEHPIRNFGNPNRHLWTDERQKKDHPTDRGFEEVSTIRHQGGLPWGS